MLLAYLVIREGSKWSDVYRLVPGRHVTIGRSPTSEIVIKSDQCSRNHAEIFLADGSWMVRDLDSRNGTLVNSDPVRGDHRLIPGDVVRIATTQLAYVNDLTSAYGETGSSGVIPTGDETVVGKVPISTQISDSNVLDAYEPTTITHRRGQTRFLKPSTDDESALPQVGRAAAQLCRLGFELASQRDIVTMANRALDGLFEGTSVDAGAVLLLPPDVKSADEGSKLEIIASRTDYKPSYQRISSFLADTVLREGQAVLARNIEGDSNLGIRDSKGEFHATSVMCAPIRQEGNTIGVIHLYSTDAERIPDPEELEFTLAVADNVALAAKNLGRQQELVEDLSVTRHEVDQLRKRLGVESEIVGSSPQMDAVHQEISRAAPSRATVLIVGESGVGKELVAQAVHYSSPRKKGPFVCLNCAALSETLLESELFGHEKGAFTGATERKFGKFEAADQGTLMLDEIGEMSQQIQAKFLRVLEGHPFERVGGSKPITVDTRVISATNRDLEKAVAEGAFRRDLFFRLHVIEIVVPPLRHRPEDVIELAEHFVRRFNSETGRKIRGFTPEALQQMRAYRWPGNVRELKNVIERAVLLSHGDFIQADDLALTNLSTASESNILSAPRKVYQPLSLQEVERRHILDTLNNTGWNKSRTASILGIERSTLDRKIRRYDLAAKRPEPNA